jgi:hypothetical protein
MGKKSSNARVQKVSAGKSPAFDGHFDLYISQVRYNFK